MAAIVEPTEEEAALWFILTDPSGIDLAEFAFVDEEQDDGCFRVWPHQWAWYRRMDPLQVDQTSRTTGKALALDTPVPTPEGWTTIGEVADGDVIYDDQGQPTVVLRAHDVLHGRACYEVEFLDGETIVADEDHLWLTWDKAARVAAGRGSWGAAERRDEMAAIAHNMREGGSPWKEVAEAIGVRTETEALRYARRAREGPSFRSKVAHPRLRTTREIAETLLREDGGSEFNHQVDVCAPIEGVEHDLLVDPYILGFWLGDGSARAAQFAIGDDDAVEQVRQLEAHGLVVKNLKPPVMYSATYPGVDKHTWIHHSLTAHLRQIGVLGDKHIPPDYLRARIKDRIALLQGLMDADGHVDTRGRCELTLTNQRLACEAYELIVSLGQKVTIRESEAKLDGRVIGLRWRIGWHPQGDVVPVRLERKRERLRSPRRKSLRRTIADVRPVPSVPVRCLTVDSPSRLYLVGRSMIPTHNTNGVILRSARFIVNGGGQQRALVAPELNHLRPLVDAVESRIVRTRLLRELFPKGYKRGYGITRSPQWQARSFMESTLITRIPNDDGRGVKGLHSVEVEIDEGQDFNEPGYKEIVEARNSWAVNSRLLVHGVPTGARNTFYRYTEPNSGFYVNRYTAMHRPSWGPEERKQRIRQYGSRESPDYRRNVYGLHGDASAKLFVIARLMNCVDLDEGSTYNTQVYKYLRLDVEQVGSEDNPSGPPIDQFLDKIPVGRHLHGKDLTRQGYASFWAGMDVGVTSSPTEVLLFGLRATKKPHLDLLLRIQLRRFPIELQQYVVRWLFKMYGSTLKGFGIDKGGPGWGLVEPLESEFKDRCWGWQFGEKILTGFEDRELEGRETMEDLAIYRPFIEATSDSLRIDWVDPGHMTLPYDQDLINDWQGQSVEVVKDSGNPYGTKKNYDLGGGHHILDAARLVAAAKIEPPLKKILEKPTKKPVLDAFPGAF